MRFLIVLLGAAALVCAEDRIDLAVVNRIRHEALQKSKVMDHLFRLTEVHGPRLTGSPNLKAAAEWAAREMKSWGLSNVVLEPWGPFGHGWSNLRFSAHLKEPQYAPLIGFARPWSGSTNGVVSGQPVLAPLRGEEDFAIWKGKLKGKIVLVQQPRALGTLSDALMKRLSDAELQSRAQAPDPARPSYGLPPAPPSRNAPPSGGEARRRWINALNRFLTEEGVLLTVTPSERQTDGGTIFATAAGSRDPKDPPAPPSVALAAEHYNRIARLLNEKVPVSVEFDVQNRFHNQTLESFNVIAEIRGADKPDEVVMMGAHLDSWTGGTGTTDNGAGCSVMMEAMRILKTLELKPARTIRVALWTGEEQGLLGSRAYVTRHFADRHTMQLRAGHAKLSGYFNFDNGTGRIRGVYLQGNDMMRPLFAAWLAPFRDLGATTMSIRDTGATDHVAFDAVGLPGFQFIQDPVEYSTRTHHSNMDVFDHAQAADLKQSAAIVASVAYHAAMREEMLPRKPLPPPEPRRPETTTKLLTDIEFARVGETSLTLDAHIPEGPGPFPAVIIVHGGGFVRGDKQTFVPPLFDPLTKSGFAWFTINYRLAPEHRFPSPVADVKRAVEWVRRHAPIYKVDPGKIALVGESAGGHLVSFAGASDEADSRVQAVVSFYGPHNLERRALEQKQISETVQAFTGVREMTDEGLRTLRDASPVSQIRKGMPPYLLIHGTKDPTVSYDLSVEMCDKMRAAGNRCELFPVEGAGHGVGGWEKTPAFQAYKQKMVDWLKQALR
jgi:acetyl esterase/lipase